MLRQLNISLFNFCRLNNAKQAYRWNKKRYVRTEITLKSRKHWITICSIDDMRRITQCVFFRWRIIKNLTHIMDNQGHRGFTVPPSALTFPRVGRRHPYWRPYHWSGGLNNHCNKVRTARPGSSPWRSRRLFDTHFRPIVAMAANNKGLPRIRKSQDQE